MSQHSLQEQPQDLKKPPKVMNCHRFFGFRPFWQDRAQDTKKFTKMLPKARQVASKFASLGTSWRQVGQHSAILAPTWPILAPRCAPTGLRREPRARPNQHLGASWRQAARQEPPNLPGTSIFLRFCFHFGTDFVKKLLRILWKTFVSFSLFPFHAKPGLTRPWGPKRAPGGLRRP